MELAACGRKHSRDCLWVGCLMELGACGGNHSRSCWSILSCLSSETQFMRRMSILSCWGILSCLSFETQVMSRMTSCLSFETQATSRMSILIGWSRLNCVSSETQAMSRMSILSCWICLSYVVFDDSGSYLMPCNSSTIMKAVSSKPTLRETLGVCLPGPVSLTELRKLQDELLRQRKLKALQK